MEVANVKLMALGQFNSARQSKMDVMERKPINLPENFFTKSKGSMANKNPYLQTLTKTSARSSKNGTP